MAEDSSDAVVKGEKKEDNAPQDVESRIQSAMRARVAHIKEQSNSLTLEGVRRLLEKDLGLEQYALDVHKRLIKQFLDEEVCNLRSYHLPCPVYTSKLRSS